DKGAATTGREACPTATGGFDLSLFVRARRPGRGARRGKSSGGGPRDGPHPARWPAAAGSVREREGGRRSDSVGGQNTLQARFRLDLGRSPFRQDQLVYALSIGAAVRLSSRVPGRRTPSQRSRMGRTGTGSALESGTTAPAASERRLDATLDGAQPGHNKHGKPPPAADLW